MGTLIVSRKLRTSDVTQYHNRALGRMYVTWDSMLEDPREYQEGAGAVGGTTQHVSIHI